VIISQTKFFNFDETKIKSLTKSSPSDRQFGIKIAFASIDIFKKLHDVPE